MKAQTKALVASVVVIALALSAVSGITYSWFSDTETSDITISTGKIDLDAQYTDVKVSSYGGAAKDVTLNGDTGTTTYLAGNVKATATTVTSTDTIGKKLAITFTNAAPGDEITFQMAVTLVNTIYVTYKQSIIMDSDAPFEISGFEAKTLQGTNVGGSSGINTSSCYMIGTAEAGADVTIKFKEDATVGSYGDRQYTIILAVQAIQMNVTPAEIAATKTISLGTASAQTTLSVQSADNSKAITVTLPTSTTTTDTGVSSVSVTAKALTASQVGADSSMTTVSSAGTFLAGVEIEKSTENLTPGDGYFTITMQVGELSTDLVSTLKVYHGSKELKTTADTDGEYYSYANGVVTIYAKTFSPFVVIDGTEATIDTARYATLSEAVQAAESGDTVTLVKDVSISDYITVAKSLTIDLNDHTLSSTKGFVAVGANDEDSAFQITIENGDVRLDSGWLVRNFYATAKANAGAQITIDDVDYTGAKGILYYAATDSSGGSITIRDSNWTCTSFGVWASGNAITSFVMEDSELKVTAGKTDGDNNAGLILCTVKGATISDSIITIQKGGDDDKSGCIEIKAGDVTISGCTLTGYGYDESESTISGTNGGAIAPVMINNAYSYFVDSEVKVKITDTTISNVVKDGKPISIVSVADSTHTLQDIIVTWTNNGAAVSDTIYEAVQSGAKNTITYNGTNYQSA